MGKPTGFLEFARVENPYRDAQARILDFQDLHIPQPADARRCQAGRCMDCGVPFCQSDFGCPLHNLIPEWNDLMDQGQEREALNRLLMTAPFPEFTGRVCPALCEKACNLEDASVTNRDNELYLIETGFEKGWIRPRIPSARTGKKIAVVGSGPAGLAAADQLNQMSHHVTVIEQADRPGGLLMYGIPNMKLPKEIIQRRVQLMEAEGIHFLLNTSASPDIVDAYDAILLCGGSRKPRSLAVPRMDARGVHFAVDYLTAATRGVLSGAAPTITARGKQVIVVGGGDTGNDCVGTALRQGCLFVTQLEMMPKAPEVRANGNPWPEWPRTLRTDYGQLEAIAVQGGDPRRYETTVKQILTNDDHAVTAVETVRLQFAGGKAQPIPGSEQTLPCDLLLIAAGFIGCEKETIDAFGLTTDPRGLLLPKDGSHFLSGKLFSAGDMRTGQSLVVRALADGRAAAQEIDRWLRHGP
ncbi:MAG: glutamate synthase subunit beta [Clostridia bacterium]|nr:glutamate synthase subunit beta [Clostridia bacterium]